MKIAFIASEAVPFAKTGGLADVSGSLPKALERSGSEVKLFMPKYDSVDEEKFGLHYLWNIGEISIKVAGISRSVHLHKSVLPGSDVEVYFIDCPYYFYRKTIYTNDPDEDERFILFSKAVIESLQHLKWVPDIIHCNDWQTGLIPLYLKDNYSWDKIFRNTSVVYTIHNMEYQGRFSSDTVTKADIRSDLFYSGGPVEYKGDVSFMKTGISFADLITTVSQKYAEEILTPEFGAGLQDTLKSRKSDLYGILNGIDSSSWDPKTDKFLPFRYSADDLSGKLKNKKYLLDQIKLPFKQDVPLIGIISRLVEQKGFDIFAYALPALINRDAQWIILGNGEERYESMFKELCHNYPDRFYSYIGFNTELSHIIEAASDIFLMPSRYEPCGLNQIYSLKYGTVPVVRKTGGLADTVLDWHEYLKKGEKTGTGFTFDEFTAPAFISAVSRALDTFNDKEAWTLIQQNGMVKDYSWNNSAKEYIDLYKKLL
jgi:starch synthase